MSITLTENALKEVKKVMEEQKMSSEENVLEVGVAGGGCSGFQYRLGFKKKSDVDALNETIYNFDGVSAVVDNRALTFINGTTVDFYQGIDKRGFTFDNPNAKGGCGCGNSFKA